MRDQRLIASRALARCGTGPLTAPLRRSATGQAARIRVPASILRHLQGRSPPPRPMTFTVTQSAPLRRRGALRTTHVSVWHAGMPYGDMRGTHRWTCVTLVTSGGTRVRQAEPVGRRRRADHAGLVQHDGLARPRAARPTGRRVRLRLARPGVVQRQGSTFMSHLLAQRAAYA